MEISQDANNHIDTPRRIRLASPDGRFVGSGQILPRPFDTAAQDVVLRVNDPLVCDRLSKPVDILTLGVVSSLHSTSSPEARNDVLRKIYETLGETGLNYGEISMVIGKLLSAGIMFGHQS